MPSALTNFFTELARAVKPVAVPTDRDIRARDRDLGSCPVKELPSERTICAMLILQGGRERLSSPLSVKAIPTHLLHRR
jgi:hypothetical protein